MENIGAEIKKVLAEKKMSITDLALQIGKNKKTLWTAIDSNNISMDILRRIAEILEVPVKVSFNQAIKQPELNEVHLLIRECAYCGKDISQSKINATFCSDKCRGLFHRRMVTDRFNPIIEMLKEGKSYSEIQNIWGVSPSTIASIARQNHLIKQIKLQNITEKKEMILVVNFMENSCDLSETIINPAYLPKIGDVVELENMLKDCELIANKITINYLKGQTIYRVQLLPKPEFIKYQVEEIDNIMGIFAKIQQKKIEETMTSSNQQVKTMIERVDNLEAKNTVQEAGTGISRENIEKFEIPAYQTKEEIHRQITEIRQKGKLYSKKNGCWLIRVKGDFNKENRRFNYTWYMLSKKTGIYYIINNEYYMDYRVRTHWKGFLNNQKVKVFWIN